MHWLDWGVVGLYCVAVLGIGIVLARRASGGVEAYFASDRKLTWWLAGTSMVATTFASDTPLFVTGIVRKLGVWANWLLWAFLVSHLATAFFFSRWWKRSGALTEVELTELRYDGPSAAALRGTKAVYWGLMINAFTVGAFPLLGMTKILGVVLGLEADTFGGMDPKLAAMGLAMVLAIAYSVLSGFWGVVVTDLLQFVIAWIGAVILCVIALGKVGGPVGLMGSPEVVERVTFLPPWPEGDFWSSPFALVLSFLLVQWWAWKNADGGGILVQRMISCRDEKHAVGGMLWFNLAHYVLRAWPWILVALASLVLLPELGDEERAYPEMAIRYLPNVVRGLVIASFFAAFMSTMDTHINWGASYLVNDLYRRFLAPGRSDAHYLLVSRLCSVLVALGAVVVAYRIDSIREAFKLILLLTAGIGPVLLGRWLWWRTNAWSEISGMMVSLYSAALAGPAVEWYFGVRESRLLEILWIATTTTAVWVGVTLLTRPVGMSRLVEFYRKVRPPRWGWGPVARLAGEVEPEAEPLRSRLVLWILGVVSLCGLNLAGVMALQSFAPREALPGIQLPRALGLLALSLALACIILKQVTGRGLWHRVGGALLVGSAFGMTLLGDFSPQSVAILFVGLALTGEQTLPAFTLSDRVDENSRFPARADGP